MIWHLAAGEKKCEGLGSSGPGSSIADVRRSRIVYRMSGSSIAYVRRSSIAYGVSGSRIADVSTASRVAATHMKMLVVAAQSMPERASRRVTVDAGSAKSITKKTALAVQTVLGSRVNVFDLTSRMHRLEETAMTAPADAHGNVSQIACDAQKHVSNCTQTARNTSHVSHQPQKRHHKSRTRHRYASHISCNARRTQSTAHKMHTDMRANPTSESVFHCRVRSLISGQELISGGVAGR